MTDSTARHSKSDQPPLHELFDEKSLWIIFWKSPSIAENKSNLGILLATLALFVVFVIHRAVSVGSPFDYPSLLQSWAELGMSLSGTILGFLLAGFAILFSVLKPSTALMLHQLQNKKYGYSELKLLLFLFLDVIFQYTLFLMWCVVYVVAGSLDGPIFLIGHYLGTMDPCVPDVITGIAFIVWGTWYVLLVLKLKAFIFNLYQSLLLAITDSMDDQRRQQ